MSIEWVANERSTLRQQECTQNGTALGSCRRPATVAGASSTNRVLSPRSSRCEALFPAVSYLGSIADWPNLVTEFRIARSLASHDLFARYARTALGPLWLIAAPLAMIGIYWTVFGMALGVYWPVREGNPQVGYILPFTAGLTIYLYLTELVTSSLALYVAKRNLVLKSPVPLWVLWLANYLRASLVAAVYLGLLVLMAAGLNILTITGFFTSLPVILLVIAMFAPVSLILALIGPFAGDLTNAVPIVLRVAFYTAPITFPLSVIPESARPYLWLNPLTSLVELLRDTLIFGEAPAYIPFII